MFRSTFLSPSHYAGKWVIPDEDQHHDLKVVNQLGYAYATSPDSPEKEEKLLRLLECFHGYLMKYVVMVVRGTLPPANSRAGKDAKELLRTLAPRKSTKDKSKPSKEVIDATCKMLHLAFKGVTTEDIYDTLAFCFMKAARKYDPYYADKTKQVWESSVAYRNSSPKSNCWLEWALIAIGFCVLWYSSATLPALLGRSRI